MNKHAGTCPLTQKELINEYFMEYRNQVIGIAAFLDRMDRSVDLNAEDDFRVIALRKAITVLCTNMPDRVERIQMLFSDPNLELLEERDRQNAFGAFENKNGHTANGTAGHNGHNGHNGSNGKESK